MQQKNKPLKHNYKLSRHYRASSGNHNKLNAKKYTPEEIQHILQTTKTYDLGNGYMIIKRIK